MAFSLTLLFAHIPSCAHYIFLCDDHSQERKAKGKERVKKQWLNQIEKHSNSLYSKKQIKQQSYITTRLWLANSKALVDICRDGWSEVKVAQSCLTLCDPMDSTVHGILQARILEWVAFPFSRGSQPRDRTQSPTLQADSLPAESQVEMDTVVQNLTLIMAWHILSGGPASNK